MPWASVDLEKILEQIIAQLLVGHQHQRLVFLVRPGQKFQQAQETVLHRTDLSADVSVFRKFHVAATNCSALRQLLEHLRCH